MSVETREKQGFSPEIFQTDIIGLLEIAEATESKWVVTIETDEENSSEGIPEQLYDNTVLPLENSRRRFFSEKWEVAPDDSFSTLETSEIDRLVRGYTMRKEFEDVRYEKESGEVYHGTVQITIEGKVSLNYDFSSLT